MRADTRTRRLGDEAAVGYENIIWEPMQQMQHFCNFSGPVKGRRGDREKKMRGDRVTEEEEIRHVQFHLVTLPPAHLVSFGLSRKRHFVTFGISE